MGEKQQFTLDELAAATGMTPRNVRAYQTRGLISPPDKRGRRSIYNHRHLRQLQAVRRARSEGATLSLISGVLTDGRRLSIPPSGRITRSETVPGTVRRRADLKRALARLGASSAEIARIVDELTDVRAVASTGVRTVATADVVARLTQAHRLDIAPDQALHLAAEAAAAVQPLVDRIRGILPTEPERSSDHVVVELMAGLIGAVVRDSLLAQLSATPEEDDLTVSLTDRLLESDEVDLPMQDLDPVSSNDSDDIEFDGRVQR
jgi:DNA-binding transcriptional MerR regulator